MQRETSGRPGASEDVGSGTVTFAWLPRGLASTRFDVTLLADLISFAKIRSKFVGDVGRLGKTKYVNVVSRRDCLYLSEQSALHASSKHKVTIKPVSSWTQLCERYSHLESDTGLLRDNPNPNSPERANAFNKDVEQCSEFPGLALEVFG